MRCHPVPDQCFFRSRLILDIILQSRHFLIADKESEPPTAFLKSKKLGSGPLFDPVCSLALRMTSLSRVDVVPIA